MKNAIINNVEAHYIKMKLLKMHKISNNNLQNKQNKSKYHLIRLNQLVKMKWNRISSVDYFQWQFFNFFFVFVLIEIV